MPSKAKVALVMPVRNEEQAVDETMQAIFQSTRLPDEIIIADGMSTDKTVERILKYSDRGVKLLVVENPTIFAGGGRNRAIEQTACEIIALADFGNKITPEWLENIVRPLEEDVNADMVAGMYEPWVCSDFEHCMAAIHYFDDYTLKTMSEAEREALIPEDITPGSLSLAIKREIWERAEGFPEWLAKGQDTMFSRKAIALGAKVVIAWDAWVYHHIRSTPAQVFSQMFFYGRGSGQMCYMSSHFIKLLGLYGLLLILLAGSVFSPLAPIVAVGGYVAYLFRTGLSKVLKIPSKPFKLRYLWLLPLVIISRDLGIILGHIFGWFEWIYKPRFRKLFSEYTKNCPAHTMKFVER